MKCKECGSKLKLLTIVPANESRRSRYSFACTSCNHREYSEIEKLLRGTGVIYILIALILY